MIAARVVPANTPYAHLDGLLLDERGQLRVHPAETLDQLDPVELRVWQHYRAVYQLPTQELVDYMRTEIGGRGAIEIGAGRGWLGRALGVPMTDSWLQEKNPEVRFFYAASGQPAIEYGPDVEYLDAAQAVQRYRPRVVFGCWVTQKLLPGEPAGDASMYGIDEGAILDAVETYIVVGSRKVHGKKRLLQRAHEVVTLPGLRSRAADRSDNVIYVWRR